MKKTISLLRANPAIMPFAPSSSPWDRKRLGFSTPPTPPQNHQKDWKTCGAVIYLYMLYRLVISYIFSILNRSTFVYVMRGGMELPAFLLLSSNSIQQRTPTKAHFDNFEKGM